jgi:hypothetical protein
MDIDIPRGRIVPVRSVKLEETAAPHPFELQHAAAVEDNWRIEKADNAALFDGRLMLFSGLALSPDGALKGRCHLVRYASFLYWRRLRPVVGVEHLFANAVLVSSDGALVATRMASTTANAGLAYFASGSFEVGDVVGSAIDVRQNVWREVLEETGIDLRDVPHDNGYHLLSLPSGNVLFSRYFLDRPADAIAAGIEAHVAAQADPEIAAPVIIRSIKDVPQRMASHMPALIAWHFSG